MAVRPQDILLRAGGPTLKRLQTLCSSGASRIEVAHTFTRATVKRAFRDRDGNAKRASAGNMALDWPSGLTDGGPLIEGARTQLVANPENFGAWTVSGTITRTGGQADPFGGTAAYNLDPTLGTAYLSEAITFTGDATKTIGVFAKSTGVAERVRYWLQDMTAGVTRIAVNLELQANGSLPTTALAAGAGTIYPVESWGNGWYRSCASPTGVLDAPNNNEVRLYPGVTSGNATLAFGYNAWDAPFPSSYQAPGEAAGVADSLTVPFNFGPMDMTVLTRMARPLYADLSGDIGIEPVVWRLGNGGTSIADLTFQQSSRLFGGRIFGPTGSSTAAPAIPAGAELAVTMQLKNFATAPAVALDTGSGLTAFATGAAPFTSWFNQTLALPPSGGNQPLFGTLIEVIFARGLHSRADMLAIP